jgi:hypothetical protein
VCLCVLERESESERERERERERAREREKEREIEKESTSGKSLTGWRKVRGGKRNSFSAGNAGRNEMSAPRWFRGFSV